MSKYFRREKISLTAINTLDLVNQTLSIQFSQSSTVIDQITYTGGSFTFASTSIVNLSKSDILLYQTYLLAYFNQINLNFPYIILTANNLAWPLSLFNIQQTFSSQKNIAYNQTSQGNQVYRINYTPINLTASFSSRSSVTITVQEFFMLINMFKQYTNQISFN